VRSIQHKTVVTKLKEYGRKRVIAALLFKISGANISRKALIANPMLYTFKTVKKNFFGDR